MLKLRAEPGFRAVPAALVLRDKAGLRLAEAKKLVDDLSEGGSVSIEAAHLGLSDRRARLKEIVEALRACHVAVHVEAEPAAAPG